MFINVIKGLYGSEVIASFSGAMLFIINQKIYHGVNRFIVFFISFIMGIIGADTTTSVLTQYLPGDIKLGRETGAFITSALVVTVSIHLIHQVGNYFSDKKNL